MSTYPITITGTPEEIGHKIFQQFCIPAIRETSKHHDAQKLANLYIGFVVSAFGAMAADFGYDNALVGAEKMLQHFRDAKADCSEPTIN